ncbi:MAG: ribonuclease HIII [Lentisphaeria bacterium]|nr:ribonuclease HIII [Lentisphaeria bacterium]
MSNPEKKKTSYVTTIDAKQLADLQKYFAEHGWELKEQQYAHFKAVGDKVNVVAYMSGKLTVQGANSQDFVEFVLEPEILQDYRFSVPEELLSVEKETLDLAPHIGVDESGKGDFFGPLVIAGVFIDEASGEKLAQTKVRDSKLIKSDREIKELAAQIREITEGRFAVVTLRNQTYNDLYRRIGNLNRLLAWGHARVIENVLDKVPDCPRALSDKFGADFLIKNALMEKGRKIILEQKTKGESDIAVAAASILAREQFVREMAKLAEEFGMDMPRGANNIVKERANAVIDKFGIEALERCVKTHFKTYGELMR